jgi:hypothetical protein
MNHISLLIFHFMLHSFNLQFKIVSHVLSKNPKFIIVGFGMFYNFHTLYRGWLRGSLRWEWRCWGSFNSMWEWLSFDQFHVCLLKFFMLVFLFFNFSLIFQIHFLSLFTQSIFLLFFFILFSLFFFLFLPCEFRNLKLLFFISI